MTDPQIAILMLVLFIGIVLLGFPIAFTLIAMGLGFGYYAYARPDQWEHIFDNRIFDLFVQNTFSVMSNDVLVAVPLFLFMGYVVERANIVDRLFFSIQIATRHVPGSMAVAALATCAVFATATGIVGAVVTLMGMLALPAMLKAGYEKKLATGVICAGGTLGILIPPSIMLIVYAAIAQVSPVRLYAAALFPGIMLAEHVHDLCDHPCHPQSVAGAEAERGGRSFVGAGSLAVVDLIRAFVCPDPGCARFDPCRHCDAGGGGGGRLPRWPAYWLRCTAP